MNHIVEPKKFLLWAGLDCVMFPGSCRPASFSCRFSLPSELHPLCGKQFSPFPPSSVMGSALIQLSPLRGTWSWPQICLCQGGQPRHLPSASQLSPALFLGCLSRDTLIGTISQSPGKERTGRLLNTRFLKEAFFYKIFPKFE